MRSVRATSAILVASALLGAALLAGCGSSSDETGSETASSSAEKPALRAPYSVGGKPCDPIKGRARAVRVTNLSCAEGQKVAIAWIHAESCTVPGGASRAACRLKGRICLSTVTDRGVQVNCAGPGKSVSFVVTRSAARAG